MNLYEGFASKAAEQGLIPALGSFAPGNSTGDESSDSQPLQASQLELHSSLLDRTYLHQLAAQAVISSRPCSEAEQFLAELEHLSLERLTLDYEARKQFIETGRDRAREEFDELCRLPKAVNISVPFSTSNEEVVMSDDPQQKPQNSNPFDQPTDLLDSPVMPVEEREAKPTRREAELKEELAEAETEWHSCSARLSHLEEAGYSLTRCAAMRTAGMLALTGAVVALAIMFDSFTSGFPLFRDVIAGIRSTFLPGAMGSQRLMMLGFIEVLLLFVLPVTIGFFLFRTRAPRSSDGRFGVRSQPRGFLVLGIALSIAYGTASLATFSNGETASRILLDFALALGCVAVSVCLVFLSVTRLSRADEGLSLLNPWWKRWERTLFPLAVITPVAVVALALTANMGSWLKLIPAGVLACVLMTGGLSLAYGMRFSDLQTSLVGYEAHIALLRAEIQKERQLTIQHLNPNSIVDMLKAGSTAAPAAQGWQQRISQIATKLIPGMNRLAQVAEKHAEIPTKAVDAVEKLLSPGQRLQSAERSLRRYEAAMMHLESRYGQLRVEHATSWKKAKIELRTAYELCRLGAKALPTPAVISDLDLALPADNGFHRM